MQQPGQKRERRHDPRAPKAFAFWFSECGRVARHSAWMLDSSAGGAAFLTASEATPPVGTWLELSEMPTCDQFVREDAGPLPHAARVVRADAPKGGTTARVAVRFEAFADVGRRGTRPRGLRAACTPQPAGRPGEPYPFALDCRAPEPEVAAVCRR